MDWFLDFWNRAAGTNGDGIISNIVILLIGIFINFVGRFLWFLYKWLSKKIVSLCKKIKVKWLEIKKNRLYKKTIKQIERMEIPISDNFLFGKSPEKNPELKKIFQMIEDGVIDAPKSYRLYKLAQGLSEGIADIKLNTEPHRINVEVFDPNKFLKK